MIASIAASLVLSPAVGVYIGSKQSNVLTATCNTVKTISKLALTWNPSPEGSNLDRGSSNGNYGVRLQNLGTATYENVLVCLRIDAGAVLVENRVRMQRFDRLAWIDVPLSGWGTNSVAGNLNPQTRFTAGPGCDITTYMRMMFEGNASQTTYKASTEADQV